MFLRKLSILNYRNIASAELTFSDKINCFVGNNGEGKTNLLDAIYFLSFTHSMFGNVDSQMVQHTKEFFMLQGEYVQDVGEKIEEIYAGLKKGVKKQFKRNKKSYKKLSEHIGLVPLIIVSPDDISLIGGGSEERRKLLDIVISQFDNTYIDYLNRYNKALQQRNALLKFEEPDIMLLSLWEEEMASYGEKIYRKRTEFIDRFTPVFNDIYKEISGASENVSLRYVSHCQRGSLLDIIRNDRHKDIAIGYSLHGIHRDDLEMLIDGYPLKKEGSQGQVKTYIISLKLAQFDFLRQTMSVTTPLLLLDDIFDKLDEKRVKKIISLVSTSDYGQIFITDTNRTHLDSILASGSFDYKMFYVKNGCFKCVNMREDNAENETENGVM